MKIRITKSNVTERIATLSKEKMWKEALDLVRRFKVTKVTVTRESIKRNWEIRDNEIASLNFIEVPNPYYKKSGAMKLFLIAEINDVFGLQLKTNVL